MIEIGLSSISGFFNQLWQAVIDVLPKSPFRGIINGLDNIPYLQELNWFIPIGNIVAITETWLGVVSVYYIYKAIMRMLHLE